MLIRPHSSTTMCLEKRRYSTLASTVTHLYFLNHTSCCLKCAPTQIKAASERPQQNNKRWYSWT